MNLSKERTKEYIIDGMDCADCALTIEKKLSKLQGIKQVRVNFLSSHLWMELDPYGPDESEIFKTVADAGYRLRSLTLERRDILKIENLVPTETISQIRQSLEEIPDVYKVKINIAEKKIIIIHRSSPEKILNVLSTKGISAKIVPAQKDLASHQSRENKKIVKPTIISGILAFGGLVGEQFYLPSYLTTIAFAVAILSGGYRIAFKGLKEARGLTLGMNFLMSMAVIGAIILGEWSEAAMVIFLFSLAQLLESYSVHRARQSIKSLLKLTPPTALVKTQEGLVDKPVEQVAIGDLILIKPGNRIPLDGKITAGASLVDQAPITGESLPVSKSEGDEVYAGSLNQEGVLEVRVDRPYQDSTIAKIIHLVEDAQAQRAPIQQFVEKFARYYTPAVVVMAFGFAIIPPLFFAGSFTEWFYRALVLLVISCPCALVISTPVTLVSALTNATRHSILIKGGTFLENFHRIKVLAIDKTGTLTYGRPAVQTVIALNNYPSAEILRIAASIEIYSEHSIAQAIVTHARQQEIELVEVHNFQAIHGRGARADINGTTFYIGNHKLFEENGWCQEKVHEHITHIENQRHTAVLVGNTSQLIGVIAIADEVRENAASAILQLKKSGIEKIVILTGDNEVTAQSICQKLGIDEFYAELLPAEKVKTIKQLKARRGSIIMVGDGINDAPALAAASIGISMGASGSDTAIETADIVLMKDDLNKIAFLRSLSKKTLKIIYQNIFISLFLKLAFFALAIPGIATLWMAVFADMGASLIVIFNGLRLLNFQDRQF